MARSPTHTINITTSTPLLLKKRFGLRLLMNLESQGLLRSFLLILSLGEDNIGVKDFAKYRCKCTMTKLERPLSEREIQHLKS
ncbi:hypothetical protein KI387_000504, partial [Taxus chinensis]